jgi:hypothetical protein
MNNREIKTLSLSETLLQLDGGSTVEEIQDHIRKVVSAVSETGNAGAVTIKLAFRRNGKHGSHQVTVSDTVTATLPKVPKPDTLFFVTEDGDLTRQNPLQPSFQSITGDRD